ncbi:glycosyltransferase [Catenovulum maritimum]|uniref:glycosyltransferase n=1 Tax=Catenovulum maritimum TaxID=1513271 RepID=UPI0006606515|nr:glycosyltransferase [Catenovulum maritimum]
MSINIDKNKSVKVLQVIQHLKVGGLEKMVIDLFTNSQFSQDMILVSLEDDKESVLTRWPELTAHQSKIICLNKPAGFSLTTINQLRKIITSRNIDIIHSHHIGPLFYASLANFGHLKVRHINTVHDAWYLKHGNQAWLTKFSAILGGVEFIADAKVVAKQFITSFKGGVKTPIVIHNGVDEDRFVAGNKHQAREIFDLPQNKILVGCAARVEVGKGHDALIRQLCFADENMHLVMAGSGSEMANLQALCRELNVENKVHWLGRVDDMPKFYQSLDVFCLFSQREGLPLSVLEAIACDTPVVATRVGGIPEIVTKANCVLIPSYAEAELSLAWEQAYNLRYQVKGSEFEPDSETNSQNANLIGAKRKQNQGVIRQTLAETGKLKQMVASYDKRFANI